MTEPCAPALAPTPGPGLTDRVAVSAPALPAATARPSGDPDWRSTLDGDLRRVAAKFETPADVVRSYSELEKRLGRSVVLPDRGASPEEIDAFHERLGWPRSPEEYDIQLPEGLAGDAENQATRGFLAAMHRAGAAGPAVQAAIDWYAGALTDSASAEEKATAARQAQAEADLRRDWGDAYDRMIAGARRAARQFGGPDMLSLFEQAGIAHHPALLRAFAAIGAATAEDSLLAADGGGAGASAQKRINGLMAEHYGRPSYVSSAVQDELRTLYAELYGNSSAAESPRDAFANLK